MCQDTIRVLAACLLAATASSACGESGIQPSPSPAVLRVTSIAPASGVAGASTPIRINGTGFERGATVSVDNSVVESSFVSSTQITAVAPSRGIGSVDVAVTNPGGQASRLERGFSYVLGVTGVTITGNVSLRSVGETSQLTAMATFSDGSTQDVSAEAQWSGNDSGVAAVDHTGLLTAGGLGKTRVNVRYASAGITRTAAATVVVTPPGTSAVWGRVRNPGSGSISGARVEARTGEAVVTRSGGEFTLGGLTDLRLSALRDGYESVEFTASADDFDDVPMQRVVRVEAGSPPWSESLAPHDVAYAVGDGAVCQPCRKIRITSATAGTVRVRVTWNDAPTVLHLWTNGQRFSAAAAPEIVADLPIAGGVEMIVYVGKIQRPDDGYVPFTFSVLPAGSS